MIKASTVDCRECPLWEGRTRIVDGEGSRSPLLMGVAEAPGHYEDISGHPFVGPSGKLLRTTVALFGLQPKDIFWTNSARCRPPGNRNPTPAEMDACLPWLVTEINELLPTVVLTLGNIARDQVRAALPYLEYVPTIIHAMHPAALLRNPKHRVAWEQQIKRAVYLARGLPDPGDGIVPVTAAPWHFSLADCPNPIWDLLDNSSVLALDTETVPPGDNSYGDILVTYQISDGTHSYMVEVPPEPPPGQGLVPCWELVLLDQIIQWQGQPGNTMLYQNTKYDEAVIERALDRSWTRQERDGTRDTMLRASEAGLPEVGMKKWGPVITGIDMHEIGTLFGRGKTKINFRQVMQDTKKRPLAIAYGCRDAVVTHRGAIPLYEKIPASQAWFYTHIEEPTVHVLYEMEKRGVLIDTSKLHQLGKSLEQEMELARFTVIDVLGSDIVTKPKLLGPRLVELGLPLTETTKTGDLDTSKPALLKACEIIKEEQLDTNIPIHRVVAAVLGFRQPSKLKATYADGLEKKLDPEGAIHTRFNQAGSASDPFGQDEKNAPRTKRLSSAAPNLQNIPANGTIGKLIRSMFIARPGYVMVVADQSQLELHIWASIMKVQFLIDAYANGIDSHGQVAAELLIPRPKAKNGMYATVYGAELPKIIATFGIPAEEGPPFIERIRGKMPALIEWPIVVENLLAHQGFVQTLYGHQFDYPLYFSPVATEQREAVRQGCNAPIQGTASEIVKMWQLRVMRELIWSGDFDAHCLLQVHDEILTEVREDQATAFARELSRIGGEVGGDVLDVPLKADAGIGANWQEAKGEH